MKKKKQLRVDSLYAKKVEDETEKFPLQVFTRVYLFVLYNSHTLESYLILATETRGEVEDLMRFWKYVSDYYPSKVKNWHFMSFTRSKVDIRNMKCEWFIVGMIERDKMALWSIGPNNKNISCDDILREYVNTVQENIPFGRNEITIENWQTVLWQSGGRIFMLRFYSNNFYIESLFLISGLSKDFFIGCIESLSHLKKFVCPKRPVFIEISNST